MSLNIYDVMKCPHCNSENCYSYDIDDIEFDADNNGHYYVDCHCKDCDKGFRLYMQFTYVVTSATTSI